MEKRILARTNNLERTMDLAACELIDNLRESPNQVPDALTLPHLADKNESKRPIRNGSLDHRWSLWAFDPIGNHIDPRKNSCKRVCRTLGLQDDCVRAT